MIYAVLPSSPYAQFAYAQIALRGMAFDFVEVERRIIAQRKLAMTDSMQIAMPCFTGIDLKEAAITVVSPFSLSHPLSATNYELN